jgi:chromosome segregation ATPase
MGPRRVALLVCLAAGLAGAVGAEEETGPSRRARPATTSRPASAASDAVLRQIVEAQRGLGDEMMQLKERFDWLHGELAKQGDEQTAAAEEVKALRDEVKGLYVESSTLKQQIDALKEDVAGVNSNVSAFRQFSGFFIALMLVALVLILALSIRR